MMPPSVLRPATIATITTYSRPSALLSPAPLEGDLEGVHQGHQDGLPIGEIIFIPGANKGSPATASMLSYDNGGLNMPQNESMVSVWWRKQKYLPYLEGKKRVHMENCLSDLYLVFSFQNTKRSGSTSLIVFRNVPRNIRNCLYSR